MTDHEPKIPEGADEKREQPDIEIWVIDDNEQIGTMIQRIGTSFSPNTKFRLFEKGADAIEELKKRLREATSLPSGVFVDGNLAKDRGIFSQGQEVVLEISRLTTNKEVKPYIVAESSDEDINKSMLENGANFAIQKPYKMVDVRNAIEKIEQHHKKTS